VPDPSTLALFAAAALALIVVPGPAVLYIVAQGIDRGRIAGVVSALGIATGGLVHVLAAAVGISSLVVSSATAFTVVKWAGAAYLVVLGVRRLVSRDGETQGTVPGRSERSLGRIYRQGVVVNVLNPKTALFFLAFLPQFVDVGAGSVALQVVVLGMTFVLLALVCDSMWGVAAGTAAGWLRSNRRALKVQRYATGGVLVGLGVATALTGSRKT
jgi:threonine/homoserine/homoserine lactone efflux protein